MLVPLLAALLLLIGPSIGALTYTSDRIVSAKNSHFRPLVAKTYDQLIFVTFPRDAQRQPFKIRFESEKIGYRPCDIRLSTDVKLERPLSLDSLACGKLILGLLTKDGGILNVVADTEICEFDQALTTKNGTNAVVVAGEDAFDVFVEGHANCTEGKACRLRYSQRAELLGATDFELPDIGCAYDSWTVNTVGEKDFAKGYFFALFTDDEGTIVRRLDQDLQVTEEKSLGKTFLFSSEPFGHVNSCRGVSAYKLDCELLDDNLRSRARFQLDAQPYRRYLRAARLFGLPSGGALLFLVLQLEGRDGFVSYIQRTDSYGRLGRAQHFQDDLCKDFGLPFGRLSLAVFRMREDMLCLSLSCRDAIRTKCVVGFDD